MEKQFWGLELQHVPRGTNKEANDIAKRALRRQPQEPSVFEERLFKPSAAPPAAEPKPLERSSHHHQPQELPHVARSQEHTCSLRLKLRRFAGLKN